MKYQVAITYLNGTVQTYRGSYRYCAKHRDVAYRLGHGWHDVERIAVEVA